MAEERMEEEVKQDTSETETQEKRNTEEYKNKYLNDLEEFNGDANIENVGEVFWKKLFMVFEKNGWALIRLEIGENPLRIYSVSTEEIRM